MCHICDERERAMREQDRQNKLAQRQVLIDAGATEAQADEIVDLAHNAVDKMINTLNDVCALASTPRIASNARFLAMKIAAVNMQDIINEITSGAGIKELLQRMLGPGVEIVVIGDEDDASIKPSVN